MPGELPSIDVQRLVATAVHDALAEHFGAEDVRTLCQYYAAVGSVVASLTTGVRYTFHAGTLRVRCHRNGGLEMDGSRQSTREFHAWIEGDPDDQAADQMIDLTSRHYRAQAARGEIAWEIDDPPEFLWYTTDRTPGYLVLIPNITLTMRLEHEMFVRQVDVIRQLISATLERIRQRIRQKAFELWDARGRPLWDDLTDWAAAKTAMHIPAASRL